ncbi:MAG: hypothetical protein KAH22_00020 [Thiotrichaceae bacterium]|nr:hypothetical protein [Thiotrichaceae bacterium]
MNIKTAISTLSLIIIMGYVPAIANNDANKKTFHGHKFPKGCAKDPNHSHLNGHKYHKHRINCGHPHAQDTPHPQQDSQPQVEIQIAAKPVTTNEKSMAAPVWSTSNVTQGYPQKESVTNPSRTPVQQAVPIPEINHQPVRPQLVSRPIAPSSSSHQHPAIPNCTNAIQHDHKYQQREHKHRYACQKPTQVRAETPVIEIPAAVQATAQQPQNQQITRRQQELRQQQQAQAAAVKAQQLQNQQIARRLQLLKQQQQAGQAKAAQIRAQQVQSQQLARRQQVLKQQQQAGQAKAAQVRAQQVQSQQLARRQQILKQQQQARQAQIAKVKAQQIKNQQMLRRQQVLRQQQQARQAQVAKVKAQQIQRQQAIRKQQQQQAVQHAPVASPQQATKPMKKPASWAHQHPAIPNCTRAVQHTHQYQQAAHKHRYACQAQPRRMNAQARVQARRAVRHQPRMSNGRVNTAVIREEIRATGVYRGPLDDIVTPESRRSLESYKKKR